MLLFLNSECGLKKTHDESLLSFLAKIWASRHTEYILPPYSGA